MSSTGSTTSKTKKKSKKSGKKDKESAFGDLWSRTCLSPSRLSSDEDDINTKLQLLLWRACPGEPEDVKHSFRISYLTENPKVQFAQIFRQNEYLGCIRVGTGYFRTKDKRSFPALEEGVGEELCLLVDQLEGKVPPTSAAKKSSKKRKAGSKKKKGKKAKTLPDPPEEPLTLVEAAETEDEKAKDSETLPEPATPAPPSQATSLDSPLPDSSAVQG